MTALAPQAAREPATANDGIGGVLGAVANGKLSSNPGVYANVWR